MDTAPLIPVLGNSHYRAWPTRPEGGRARYLPLGEALTQKYKTDAHAAAYSLPSVERRLDSDAPTKHPIPMVAVIFDVDGHEVPAEGRGAWWAEEKIKIGALAHYHRGALAYQTRGGYRLVFRLGAPVVITDGSDAKSWTALYGAWVRYLARRFGIVADGGCKDWTRLFRLPHATREEGGKPEDLEIIGDPNAIGVWGCELSADDMREEPKAVHAPNTRPAISYTGRGRLVEAFANRGWVGQEIDPGKHAAICPWSTNHTKGDEFDTSTIIYEATPGRDLGWFHCSHSHCTDRSLEDVLRNFTAKELGICGAENGGKACPATDDLYTDGKCVFHSATNEAKAARRAHVEERQRQRQADSTVPPEPSDDTADSSAPGPTPTLGFPLIRVCDIPEIVTQEFLIEGLIPRYPNDGTAGYLFAPEKARKSLLLADLSLSVATGTPALGRWEVNRPGAVVGFFAEDPKGETSRRVHRLARGRGVEVPANLLLLDLPALAIDSIEHQTKLTATLKSVPDLALVFLDPMVRLHTINDNHANEIGPIHTFLRGLARSLPGTVFLLAHHLNHNGGARGSTDYPAFGDFNLYGRKADDLTTEITKIENRGGAPIKGFRFTVEDGAADDGATMRLLPTDLDDAAPLEQKTSAVEATIRDMRRAEPLLTGREAIDRLRSMGIKFSTSTFWDSWRANAGA